MKRKFLIPALSVLLSLYGCVKETYDMDKVSKKAHLSPTMFVPVFKGTATFGDIVKENDTVVYGDDKSVKIIIRQDSVIDLDLKDFYNLANLVSFNKDYQLGELKIDPFQGSMNLSLSQLIQGLPAILKNQITALDDGGSHPFPALPAINMSAQPFTQFSNIQEARFSSGFIDISVTNNLNTPLNSIQITLSNAYGTVGTPVTIPSAAPGELKTASINLAGARLTNTLSATVSLGASPGNSTPVKISLTNNKLAFTVKGRDLRISSGTVILPQQDLSSGPATDNVMFTPVQAIEIEKMGITTGNLSWDISTSITALRASANLVLSGIKRSGTPLSTTISVSSGGHGAGSISLNNTVLDLNSDVNHPYNKFPFEYRFNVSSNNALVQVSSTDVIRLGLGLTDPAVDYIKGYFGQEVETINETHDLDIKDIVNSITGTFHIADPKVRVNYSNSFAVPMQVMMDIEGIRGDKTANLNIGTINIKSPEAPASRDISDFILIDNSNNLSEFVSLPPERVVISGSAKMNPAGDPLHLRNNYIFGNSRFLGSLEVEVPLEIGLNNFHFRDTTDNFIVNGDTGIKPGDASLVAIDVKAENGFPFGVSFAIRLYDPVAKRVINSVVVNDFLKAAPVDATTRKVNGVTETQTRIELTEDFLDDISKADQIIIDFGISTTEAKDVKIYSDYTIDFSVVMGLNADINIDL
ncbi:MAG TPA: hypothetical protein VK213_04050 [Bacteroidales bacterium]|nr:hypothetical protein [Bacteroidales bacterium]